MSFTQVVKRKAERERRRQEAADRDKPRWIAALRLPEQPDSLLDAAYLTPLITVDCRTHEVLMISPQAELPHRANQ